MSGPLVFFLFLLGVSALVFYYADEELLNGLSEEQREHYSWISALRSLRLRLENVYGVMYGLMVALWLVCKSLFLLLMMPRVKALKSMIAQRIGSGLALRSKFQPTSNNTTTFMSKTP